MIEFDTSMIEAGLWFWLAAPVACLCVGAWLVGIVTGGDRG